MPNSRLLQHDDLVELKKEYKAEAKDNLDFCYHYLNFFTGLLVTILGFTIAGIIQVEAFRPRDLVLIAGPILAIILAILGYRTIKVFYRRFIEAWITVRNIEEMVADEYAERSEDIPRPPLYPSRNGGFIARFERYPIQQLLREAERKDTKAEDLVEEVTRVGDTLAYARLTFTIFITASSLLLIAIFWFVLET